jgi:DNA-binding phage protein
LIKYFRAQSLAIPYTTYKKKVRTYFPDFIFLTPEGYLAIVESKPTHLMSTFMVRCKYEALKDYCEQHGFIYAMMDEQLQTFSQTHAMNEENEITRYVEHLLATAGLFNDFAMKMVYSKFKNLTQKAIKDIVSRFVIQHDFYNPSSLGFKLTQQRFSMHRLQKHRLKNGTTYDR